MATTRLKRSVPGCHQTSVSSSRQVQRRTFNVQRPGWISVRLPQRFHPTILALRRRMVKITRFEDIESWKKARTLTKEIYQTTAAGKFVNDFGLKDQIRRASVSILSNIAKGSCGEVRAQLYVALDQGYISTEVFDRLLTNANEVGQLLSGFIRYLKGSTLRGNKYS